MATPHLTTPDLYSAMEHLINCNPDLALFARLIARETALGDETAALAAVDRYLASWGAATNKAYDGARETMMQLVTWFQFMP